MALLLPSLYVAVTPPPGDDPNRPYLTIAATRQGALSHICEAFQWKLPRTPAGGGTAFARAGPRCQYRARLLLAMAVQVCLVSTHGGNCGFTGIASWLHYNAA